MPKHSSSPPPPHCPAMFTFSVTSALSKCVDRATSLLLLMMLLLLLLLLLRWQRPWVQVSVMLTW